MNRECLIVDEVELAGNPQGLTIIPTTSGNGNGKVLGKPVAGAANDLKLLTSAGDLVRHLAKALWELQKATTRDERIELLGRMHNHLNGLSSRLAGAKLEVLAAIAHALGKLFSTFSRDFDTVNISSLRTSSVALDILGRALSNPDATLLRNAVFRILVVDDQAVCRHTLSMALNSPHLKLHVCEDAAAALALLKANAYDAVFTDIIMPEMDGFGLVATLRRITGHERTPVVFVTALSDFETRAKSALSGGCDLIGKPYSASEVIIKALTIALKHRLEPEPPVKAPEPVILPADENKTPTPIPLTLALRLSDLAPSEGRSNDNAQPGNDESRQPEPIEIEDTDENPVHMAAEIAFLEQQLEACQNSIIIRSVASPCQPGRETLPQPAVEDAYATPASAPAGQGASRGVPAAEPLEMLLERERTERRLLERRCARLEADIQHYLHQLAGHKTLEEGFNQREEALKRQLDDEVSQAHQATQATLAAQATANRLLAVKPACQALHNKLQISAAALNEASRKLSNLMAQIPNK